MLTELLSHIIGSMIVIAIVGQKGGAGKTTTAIGLAVAAADMGQPPKFVHHLP